MADNESILRAALSDAMSHDETLKSINDNLTDLNKSFERFLSQSAAASARGGDRSTEPFSRNGFERSNNRSFRDGDDRWRANRDSASRDFNFRPNSKKFSNIFDEFTDALEASMWDGLDKSHTGDILSESINKLAEGLGVSLEDLGPKLGDQLGKELADAIKNTSWGSELSDTISRVKGNLDTQLDNTVKQLTRNLTAENGPKSSGFKMSDIKDFGQSVWDGLRGRGAGADTAVVGELGSLTGELQGLGVAVGEAAATLGPYIAAAVALEIVTEYLGKRFKQVGEDAQEVGKALGDAADRANAMKRAMAELGTDRLKNDIKSLIEASYQVLEDASNRMLESWDNNLRTIAGTQGYTKADLQDLISAFAQRLRSEGLASVVSAADITDNLSKVLQSGLSGQVAEEFAYMATKLNAAIPTEDFFSYASTYASIAANALQQGASQADAIAYANAELESFASNLLYSSRTLAGGFSTGLTNASKLLEDATKIATSSRTGDVSLISGVLTSVSAIVGAVAPDLADSLVSAVVDAATGGNSDSLIALRSLAGTGASNTAFLNALASDPQKVFSTLFTNLSNMQNMSSANFMEVAESLSGVFGIDMSAFARVDFNYLADAINNMKDSSSALDENMQLLMSGQTTLTAEQLKNQQINEYMINEGLAYVLDNEAARAIQQHMWDEQIALEIKENEFSVNLTGTAANLLQSIEAAVDAVLTILNPARAFGKIANILDTIKETQANGEDIKAVLEAGKVGSGNAAVLHNLTTRGQDLNLAKSYVELLGGQAASRTSKVGNFVRAWGNAISVMSLGGTLERMVSSATAPTRLTQNVVSMLSDQITSTRSATRPSSSYSWGTIGKSVSSALGTSASGSAPYAPLATSANVTMQSAASSRLQDFLGTMQSFVDNKQSYNEWVQSASSFGIANLDDALGNVGLTQAQTKGQFEQMEAMSRAGELYERELKENQFWDDSIAWYEEKWPVDEETTWAYFDNILTHQDTIIELTNEEISQLITSNKQLKEFYDQWIDYYVNHTAYSQETFNAFDVAKIRNAERSEHGDAILALADALTSNAVDLKDPQVQSNALLAQILIVVEAIMQQQNNNTTLSLPTALAALGIGAVSDNTPNGAR